jgi:hypothetical protein
LRIFPSQEKTTELRNNYKERKAGYSGVGRCLKIGGLIFWAGFVGGSGKFEK